MIDWYLVVNQERETECEACVLAKEACGVA